MGDFALHWDAVVADLAIVDDDVNVDDGLRTAVLLSLFTDRRADVDDDLPGGVVDRRGWWGDEFADVRGDLVGSRLWLLERAKRSADVAARAEELVKEALSWLVDDRVAADVDVNAELGDRGLDIDVVIRRPTTDPVTFRFAHVWEGEARQVAP